MQLVALLLSAWLGVATTLRGSEVTNNEAAATLVKKSVKEHLQNGGNDNDDDDNGNFALPQIPQFLEPDLTGFNWSAGGQYVAEGYAWFNSQWPVETSKIGPFNASLAIDPLNGVATFLFAPRAQYVVPEGFFYVDATGICYTIPTETFSTYQSVYRQMRNWATHFDPLLLKVIKSWGGSVKDPAFGGYYGTVMAQTDPKGRVTTYGFQQTLVQPLPPPVGNLNSKVFGSFVFTKWKKMAAPPQYRNPPPSCAPGLVQNYTAVWYKPGVYFHPYPV